MVLISGRVRQAGELSGMSVSFGVVEAVIGAPPARVTVEAI